MFISKKIYLGLSTIINNPMTLAEITDPEDNYNEGAVKTKVIGFRREVLIEN